MVEEVMRDMVTEYRKALTRLDPFDPQLTQKATALTAKMQALLALNRRFYRLSDLEELAGESSIDA